MHSCNFKYDKHRKSLGEMVNSKCAFTTKERGRRGLAEFYHFMEVD